MEAGTSTPNVTGTDETVSAADVRRGRHRGQRRNITWPPSRDDLAFYFALLAISWWPLAFIAQFTPWPNQLLWASAGAFVVGGIGLAVFSDDDGSSTSSDDDWGGGSGWWWLFASDDDGGDWD